MSSNRTFLTPEVHFFEYMTDDEDRSRRLLGFWLGAERERTVEKRQRGERGEKQAPLVVSLRSCSFCS